MKIDILRFLDCDNRIKVMPSKKQKREEVLKYLASKFEFGKFYKEKEVNSIIQSWHTFNDYFLLRRELVESNFLTRTRNGEKYWKEEKNNLQE